MTEWHVLPGHRIFQVLYQMLITSRQESITKDLLESSIKSTLRNRDYGSGTVRAVKVGGVSSIELTDDFSLLPKRPRETITLKLPLREKLPSTQYATSIQNITFEYFLASGLLLLTYIISNVFNFTYFFLASCKAMTALSSLPLSSYPTS
jgi:hypothetical protein